MDGRYLLDTNIVIALFDGQLSIQEAVAEASEVFLPAIVVGELYFGAFRSNKREANCTRLEEFVKSIKILACDGATALHFGLIKNDLHAQGRPIPDNDLWIAALAQQHGLTLVTRDEHFKALESLRLATW